MDESAQRFLQFYYPEAKDLCKHFWLVSEKCRTCKLSIL
jgi:hypothetical protein